MSKYKPNPDKGDFYEKLSKAIEFVKQDKYKEHLYTAEEKNTKKDYLKNLFNDSIFDNSNLDSEFGGKAKTLYELANNAYKKDNYARVHFTIPKGFALSTHIFDLLYKDSYTEIKSILSKLEKYDINGIISASKQIQDIMTERQRSGIPERLKKHIFYSYKEVLDFSSTGKVIVRSSANVEDGGRFSYAGLFKSIPNVNKNNLIDAIFEVHRSLYSAPAIQYALINGIRDFGKMGVLVQEQIDSVASAIAFTDSPIPEYSKHYDIVINDGFGGKLMSGKVKDNRFIVDKTTDKVIHEQLSYPSKKHYEYLKSITPILHNLESLENDINRHLDCEFAIKQYAEDNRIVPFLVQCRPQTITGTEYKRTKDEIIGRLRKDDSDIIRKGDILLTDNILQKHLYKYDISEAIILWSKDQEKITDLSISHAEIILREILAKNNTPLLIKPEIEHPDIFECSDWARIDLKNNKVFPHNPKEKTR